MAQGGRPQGDEDSYFRQRTSEHLDRIREGRVETITQNGQAAMVVMSPERYDFLVHSAERGHIWREAIRAHRAGEPGVPAREAIRSVALRSLVWSCEAIRRDPATSRKNANTVCDFRRCSKSATPSRISGDQSDSRDAVSDFIRLLAWNRFELLKDSPSCRRSGSCSATTRTTPWSS